MTDLADRIARLEEALDSGHLKVQYKDRSVEYRSISEMRSLLGDLKERAGLRKAGRRRVNPTFDNGL